MMGGGNVSLALSNVKDTKKLRIFWLKIVQKLIIHLRMKIHLVTVRLDKWKSWNKPWNQLIVYFVSSDIICGITIQIIKDVLI